MDSIPTLNPNPLKTTTTESDVCYFCYQDIDKNLENGNRVKVDPDASSSSFTRSPVTLHDLCECKGSTRVVHTQCFLRYFQHSSYSGVCTVCKSLFRFTPDTLARLQSVPVDHENDSKNSFTVLITLLRQQRDRDIHNNNNNEDENDYYFYEEDEDEESPLRPPRHTTLFRSLLKKYTFTVVGSSMFFLSLLQFSVFFFFVFNNLSISSSL